MAATNCSQIGAAVSAAPAPLLSSPAGVRTSETTLQAQRASLSANAASLSEPTAALTAVSAAASSTTPSRAPSDATLAASSAPVPAPGASTHERMPAEQESFRGQSLNVVAPNGHISSESQLDKRTTFSAVFDDLQKKLPAELADNGWIVLPMRSNAIVSGHYMYIYSSSVGDAPYFKSIPTALAWWRQQKGVEGGGSDKNRSARIDNAASRLDDALTARVNMTASERASFLAAIPPAILEVLSLKAESLSSDATALSIADRALVLVRKWDAEVNLELDAAKQVRSTPRRA